MVQRSETADQIVITIGFEAASKLFKAYGGKQVLIPNGLGRPGPFSLWLKENLGEAAVDALQRNFGGERITVPKGKVFAMIARNRHIVADYNAGTPLLDLVRKYDLTERRLRTILNQPTE